MCQEENGEIDLEVKDEEEQEETEAEEMREDRLADRDQKGRLAKEKDVHMQREMSVRQEQKELQEQKDRKEEVRMVTDRPLLEEEVNVQGAMLHGRTEALVTVWADMT